jgi:hypothetical protein
MQRSGGAVFGELKVDSRTLRALTNMLTENDVFTELKRRADAPSHKYARSNVRGDAESRRHSTVFSADSRLYR